MTRCNSVTPVTEAPSTHHSAAVTLGLAEPLHWNTDQQHEQDSFEGRFFAHCGLACSPWTEDMKDGIKAGSCSHNLWAIGRRAIWTQHIAISLLHSGSDASGAKRKHTKRNYMHDNFKYETYLLSTELVISLRQVRALHARQFSDPRPSTFI